MMLMILTKMPEMLAMMLTMMLMMLAMHMMLMILLKALIAAVPFPLCAECMNDQMSSLALAEFVADPLAH